MVVKHTYILKECLKIVTTALKYKQAKTVRFLQIEIMKLQDIIPSGHALSVQPGTVSELHSSQNYPGQTKCN